MQQCQGGQNPIRDPTQQDVWHHHLIGHHWGGGDSCWASSLWNEWWSLIQRPRGDGHVLRACSTQQPVQERGHLRLLNCQVCHALARHGWIQWNHSFDKFFLFYSHDVCQGCRLVWCVFQLLSIDYLLFLFFQELEAIKARVREMEEEAEKLKELQNEVEKQMNLSPPPGEFIWEERVIRCLGTCLPKWLFEKTK